MSKYQPLWQYVENQDKPDLTLTFDQIKDIAGVPIDHSFLRYKKELEQYGYAVGKISMKKQTVDFEKTD